MKFKPSLVALGCILCSRQYAGVEPVWNPAFKDITGYSNDNEDLQEIQYLILDYYKQRCDKKQEKKEKDEQKEKEKDKLIVKEIEVKAKSEQKVQKQVEQKVE